MADTILIMVAYTLGIVFRFLIPYGLKYFNDGIKLPIDWRYAVSSFVAFLIPVISEASKMVLSLDIAIFDGFVAMENMTGVWAAFLSALAINEMFNNAVKGIEIKRA